MQRASGWSGGDRAPGGGGTRMWGRVVEPGRGGAVVIHPPWSELPQAALSVQGGTASSPGGQGQAGRRRSPGRAGRRHVRSDAAGARARPSIPAAPADAMTLDAAALAADVSVGPTRGDLGRRRHRRRRGDPPDRDQRRSVRRPARCGRLISGRARQGIELEAGGTIYVSGTVDASGAPDTGQAGGAIHLSATQIVITGQLLASGGERRHGRRGGRRHADGDPGGRVERRDRGVRRQRHRRRAVTGGAGGALDGDGGRRRDPRGHRPRPRRRGDGRRAAAARGGAAATLTIDADGAVTLGGIIDARGGLAKASGAGGAIVGRRGRRRARRRDRAPRPAIAILVPVDATGGDGDAGRRRGRHRHARAGHRQRQRQRPEGHRRRAAATRCPRPAPAAWSTAARAPIPAAAASTSPARSSRAAARSRGRHRQRRRGRPRRHRAHPDRRRRS